MKKGAEDRISEWVGPSAAARMLGISRYSFWNNLKLEVTNEPANRQTPKGTVQYNARDTVRWARDLQEWGYYQHIDLDEVTEKLDKLGIKDE